MTEEEIAQLSINTLRTLSIDAIQAANSGHPGTPMGIAPVMYSLWQRFLRFDPDDPIWPNRDRFVLSAGHASMLLYSMLHLTGVKGLDSDYNVDGTESVSLDAIKAFRQLGSRCPGHPEYGRTSGVETTTGPLGQGVATSVGMAIALKWLAARYNRPGLTLFDANVYALSGDGCMMEGISNEAASLAGHFRLGNLCWIYDRNRITIEGATDLAFDEDVAARFVAYGWKVIRVSDANNLECVDSAFQAFADTEDRPTLIVVNSHIGYGSPHKHDSAAAHGEPLGADEVKLTKASYGWPESPSFLIPDQVQQHFANGIGSRGCRLRMAWQAMFREYARQYPQLADEIVRMQRRELPEAWDRDLPVFAADSKGLATREASGQVLNAVARNVPWLIGGSADLAPSTKTRLIMDDAADFQAGSYCGRNLHFGVREHAMTAILNGLSLTGVRPFGSGFFIFSDYARGALRLGALMELPVIHIFSHDSIAVGEDGPTHQPIEQLANLRAMPGLLVIRPCDANEVVEAWKVIMAQRHVPVALVLTRQALPTLDRAKYAAASGLARGAYILAEAPDGNPDVLLLTTGSEVALCVAAYEQLGRDGINARVVSMPCWRLFEEQPVEYRNAVLPPSVKARVSVEEGSTFGWARYVGENGASLGIDSFGASAPSAALQQKFGFTVENVVANAKRQVQLHARCSG